MTQQPIKKYRKKVTGKSILKGAMRINALYDINFDDCLKYSKVVLEADAEVRQGILQNVTGNALPAGKKFFFANSHNRWGNKLLGERPDCDYYKTLEQFNAEWEELEQ
jgi:hypothetical protein